MKNKRFQSIFEVVIIIGLASIPLFVNLPYRAYIYLSWEGAYRLSEGQIPFRDFGLPLGGMYWVVPGIFFKIFGSQVITLIKAQFFLNVIAGLTFRQILRTLRVNPLVIFPAVLLFCLSYSFQNFWPWYNHSVIVYGLIAILFSLKSVFNEDKKKEWLFPALAGLFTFFSIFTKHDAGVLMMFLCICLFTYTLILERKWLPFTVYILSSIIFIAAAVAYFSQYHFGYWFNHGQKPHNSRLSIADFINVLLDGSEWLKFYLIVITLLVVIKVRGLRRFIADKSNFVLLMLTMGMLCIAAIIQVTSYVPVNGNVFFHSFAITFILNYILANQPTIRFRGTALTILSIGIVLWWSRLPWEYAQRLFFKNQDKNKMRHSPDGENIVNMHNARFMTNNVVTQKDLKKDESKAESNKIGDRQKKWSVSTIPSLKKITIPKATIDGILRLKKLDIVKQKAGKGLNVLNMSELTFLAAELQYEPERNPEAPLWHHLGVGMFNKQLKMYESRIENGYYDLVLFEYIPDYNNFFPFKIQEVLSRHYQKADEFAAPRANAYQMTVEVYIKK